MYNRFTFLGNTIRNLLEVTSGKFSGNYILPFILLTEASLVASRNPFTMITDPPKRQFRYREFILLIKIKEVISMIYGSSRSNQK